MRIDRQEVYNMFDGHCAYCGCEIDIKAMQVDHKRPKRNFYRGNDIPEYHHDDLQNLFPSCRRCNKWKDVFTIEQFRREISLQTQRLKRDIPGYRLALSFGLINETTNTVQFYFETII